MINAAGIMFLTPQNTTLFLKRGNGGDYPDHWCFPGGRQEEGESTEACAVRETVEEAGKCPKGARTLWTRQVSPEGVDFSTYLQRIPEEFEPTLCDEHTGYAWAPVTGPPEPLHPGARIALQRLTMDELGIARAMAEGSLTSPQRYENVTLFAIRLTGTGAAYRKGLDEYVWRDPSLYLNEEFLARCNGLPVVLEHPKGSILNSGEFDKRAIGTIFFPYIKGDEVWGIAKIYDDAAIHMMTDEKKPLSTSPGVSLDPKTNIQLRLESGEKLLIEGKPRVLDHVAVCGLGVWDKGGDPSGVPITKGTTSMTEEEKAALARADAETNSKMDRILNGLDSIGKRLDSIEGRVDSAYSRLDAMEEEKEKKADEDSDEEAKKKAAEEQAKKDAEEKAKKDEEEKAKKDAEEKDKARADSQAAIAARLADLEKRIPVALSEADRAALSNAQARADSVYQAFGDRAPRYLDGENLIDYRRRLANKMKDHSPSWQPVDLTTLNDSALAVAETQIFADALKAAERPSNIPEGTFREVVRTDHQTGTRKIEFYGKGSFVRGFKPPTAVKVTKFLLGNRDGGRN